MSERSEKTSKRPAARSASTNPTTDRPPRIRRSAEDARAAILDAAQRRLVESGPAAIRLKEVADEVGVSHPTVLHHFGSRERLVDAVVERRVDDMNRDVLEVIATGADSPRIVSDLFERLAGTFGAGGHARLVAFLALERRASPIVDGVRPLAIALHAKRERHFAELGLACPSFEDTFYTVVLSAVVLFGEAIAGRIFRGDQTTEESTQGGVKFRAWFARLVQAHLDTPR